MSLEPGMFVAELDRPWLETPFALQGFVIRDSEEVLYVSHYVDHVYVDAEYRGRPTFLSLATEPTARDPRTSEQLQRQIESTDKQIDRLVYELYDLTEEEIKIVEETV
jgi:hypothetical protein